MNVCSSRTYISLSRSVMVMVKKDRERCDKFQQSCHLKSTKWTPGLLCVIENGAMRSSEGDDVNEIIMVEIKSAYLVHHSECRLPSIQPTVISIMVCTTDFSKLIWLCWVV